MNSKSAQHKLSDVELRILGYITTLEAVFRRMKVGKCGMSNENKMFWAILLLKGALWKETSKDRLMFFHRAVKDVLDITSRWTEAQESEDDMEVCSFTWQRLCTASGEWKHKVLIS